MRIALDIMGGDNAPSAIVDGLKLFAEKEPNVQFVLTGPQKVVEDELKRVELFGLPQMTIVDAPDLVLMEDSPRESYKSKKNSSIKLAVQSVRENKADAFVSMGNTGACVFTSQLMLGVLPGVKRPGLAIPFPTFKGNKPCIMMDMGASVNPKAEHLVGYGIMAYYYCKTIFGIDNPRVGLMNVGEEAAKGNDVVKDAYAQLQRSGVNFKGNAEGDDIFKGKFDVIVCDGFTGNVLLKACEQLAKSILGIIKDDIKASFINQLATWVLSPVFKNMKKKTDPSEFGGALLLGVNGICVIGHGKANALAVYNALKVAKNAHEQHLNEQITAQISNLNQAIA